MKKFLLVLAALVATTVYASAQRAEITVSYGGFTQMDAMDNHDHWYGVNNAWGAVNAGINFKVAPKFWVGPSYTFSSATTDGGPYHSNIAYHAILLNGRYEYYRNNIVTLYGHLGIGTVISYMMPRGYENYSKAYFAFQASPLGANVELSRNLSMFGELGFGAQGLVQVGLRIGL